MKEGFNLKPVAEVEVYRCKEKNRSDAHESIISLLKIVQRRMNYSNRCNLLSSFAN